MIACRLKNPSSLSMKKLHGSLSEIKKSQKDIFFISVLIKKKLASFKHVYFYLFKDL